MFQWYVINTYSGHENKVKQNLEHRIQSMGAQRRFRRAASLAAPVAPFAANSARTRAWAAGGGRKFRYTPPARGAP